MQDGVLLLDADLNAVFANRALERHLGASPANAGELFPPALRDAVQRAASSEPVTVEIERPTPHKWLTSHRRLGRRWIGPAGGDRLDRGPPPGAGAPRLRHERLPRTQDPGRLHPGGRRDPARRPARRRGHDHSIRRAAGAGGAAPLADRRRPARPVPARGTRRARRTGAPRCDHPRRGRAVRGRGPRGRRAAPARAAAAGPRCWAYLRPLADGSQPPRQRDPPHRARGRRDDGAGGRGGRGGD